MLKRNIELIRDGERQVLLTWHKPDGNGGRIPIAIEFSDGLDAETRERVELITKRPITERVDGALKTFQPGSPEHFVGLTKILARAGFRSRLF